MQEECNSPWNFFVRQSHVRGRSFIVVGKHKKEIVLCKRNIRKFTMRVIIRQCLALRVIIVKPLNYQLSLDFWYIFLNYIHWVYFLSSCLWLVHRDTILILQAYIFRHIILLWFGSMNDKVVTECHKCFICNWKICINISFQSRQIRCNWYYIYVASTLHS